MFVLCLVFSSLTHEDRNLGVIHSCFCWYLLIHYPQAGGSVPTLIYFFYFFSFLFQLFISLTITPFPIYRWYPSKCIVFYDVIQRLWSQRIVQFNLVLWVVFSVVKVSNNHRHSSLCKPLCCIYFFIQWFGLLDLWLLEQKCVIGYPMKIFKDDANAPKNKRKKNNTRHKTHKAANIKFVCSLQPRKFLQLLKVHKQIH